MSAGTDPETAVQTSVRTHRYVRGRVHPNTNDCATFEFKPPDPTSCRGGGGYPRWRSTEHCGWTSRRGSQTVQVPVHRLAAVVWCYDMDTPLAEIQADMIGKDVHHRTGFPSATVETFDGDPGLEVIDHGEHSRITHTPDEHELRAWAADAQRVRDGAATIDADRCVECGATEPGWAIEGVEGEYCLDCATDRADGRTITEA